MRSTVWFEIRSAVCRVRLCHTHSLLQSHCDSITFDVISGNTRSDTETVKVDAANDVAGTIIRIRRMIPTATIVFFKVISIIVPHGPLH